MATENSNGVGGIDDAFSQISSSTLATDDTNDGIDPNLTEEELAVEKLRLQQEADFQAKLDAEEAAKAGAGGAGDNGGATGGDNGAGGDDADDVAFKSIMEKYGTFDDIPASADVETIDKYVGKVKEEAVKAGALQILEVHQPVKDLFTHLHNGGSIETWAKAHVAGDIPTEVKEEDIDTQKKILLKSYTDRGIPETKANKLIEESIVEGTIYDEAVAAHKELLDKDKETREKDLKAERAALAKEQADEIEFTKQTALIIKEGKIGDLKLTPTITKLITDAAVTKSDKGGSLLDEYNRDATPAEVVLMNAVLVASRAGKLQELLGSKGVTQIDAKKKMALSNQNRARIEGDGAGGTEEAMTPSQLNTFADSIFGRR